MLEFSVLICLQPISAHSSKLLILLAFRLKRLSEPLREKYDKNRITGLLNQNIAARFCIFSVTSAQKMAEKGSGARGNPPEGDLTVTAEGKD